ncbi:MAG: SgcJ/EcaC family oxidoreductase [Anaerolineales bacterium]|uniref:YybH family protein n=1 Tax=Candidatus Villigracilis vicinus TaxID=3140679 RepID=UPI0031363B40|nr:SgcJ/EcaC family oxidoreductase [Anaerolineales bacterium]MBK7449533.1 SgcJ/EcaC family oxidoreductase [Anaerolineales bacterium]MBK9780584.1 SgcJ/EcaC family oxidoreductase [Anaerolineales bacterium]
MNELKKQIQEVFDGYKSAVFEKDAEAFLSHYTEDIHIFDLWEKWSYEGIDAWRGMVTGWFGSLGDEKVIVDFDDIQVNASDDIAIAHAYITYKALSVDGQELRSMNNRLTLALKRTKSGWKIFHQHSSAPIDGDTLKVMFKRA